MFVYNNTTATNETEDVSFVQDGSFEAIIIQFYEIYFVVGTVTSFSTLIFGIVSWIVIKKWRKFRNYVFLNVIFNYTILFPLFFYRFNVDSDVYLYCMGKIIYFLVDSFSCWLFLATIMIYRDIVKVFSHQMTRKFLKYNIFGWGLPLLDTIVCIVSDFGDIDFFKNYEDNDILLVLLLLVNFVIYIRVLCSLLKSPSVRRNVGGGHKLQASTFTFVMSGIILLISVLMSARDTLVYGVIPGIFFITQAIVINVCFLLLKPNRKLWREYCNKVPTDFRSSTQRTMV